MYLLMFMALAHGTCSSLIHANDNRAPEWLHRHLPIAWSDDGRLMAYRTARGWHVRGTLSSEPGARVEVPAGQEVKTLSRDGRFYVTRAGGDYTLFDVLGRARLRIPSVERIGFSRGGQAFWRVHPWRGDVTIYDLPEVRRRAQVRIPLGAEAVWGLHYDEETGRFLARFTGDRAPAWIDELGGTQELTPPPRLTARMNGDPVHDFLATERYLETSGQGGRFTVVARGAGNQWGPEYDVQLDAFAGFARVGQARLSAAPTAIAVSADGRTVAVATESPGRIYIYDLPRMGQPRRVITFDRRVDHLAFVEGRVVAFVAEPGTAVAF